LRAAIATRQPPARKGRRLKIFYGTQVGTRPPQIVLFVNDPALLHVSYQRFLENQIRMRFGFAGTPLRLILRARRGEGSLGAGSGRSQAAPESGRRPVMVWQTTTVAVLGGGSWGTALAQHLAGRGLEPLLWVRQPERAADIRRARQNSRYLPGVALAPQIRITADLEEAFQASLLF